MTARVRTAVFISGGGSNMAALIKAARAPEYPARVALVVSNEPNAGGLIKAREAGVETQVIDHRDYPDRAAFDAALTHAAEDAGCEIICLAGFMRLLTPGFTAHWRDKLLNIHPALLPKYKGLNTHARALAAGETEHGCTVHLVRAEMDTGPVIEQAKVPVLPDDTPETLAARVLAEEHRIYPAALAQVCAARAGKKT